MNSFLNNIQFVVVLYNESLEKSKSFRDITNSIKCFSAAENLNCHIFIYDNSPNSQELNLDKIWEYEYFHDNTNSGVSRAYNTAAKFAKLNDREWIFLLDQDTEFPEDSIAQYYKAINENPNISLFSPILKINNGEIVSPYKYIFKRRKRSQDIHFGINSLHRTSPINSGLCINVNVFFEVGGYNENVKLDGSDFQFIERFKQKNTNYFVVPIVGVQDLSLNEKNFQKIVSRYKIFLSDLSYFESFSKIDFLFNFWYGLSRTLRLTIQTKKNIFVKLFFKSYILKK